MPRERQLLKTTFVVVTVWVKWKRVDGRPYKYTYTRLRADWSAEKESYWLPVDSKLMFATNNDSSRDFSYPNDLISLNYDWLAWNQTIFSSVQTNAREIRTLEAVQINISHSRNCTSKVSSPHVLASGDWKFQRQTQISISVVLVHINSSLFGIQVVREKWRSYQQLGKPEKKKWWIRRQNWPVVSSEKYEKRGEIHVSRETRGVTGHSRVACP